MRRLLVPDSLMSVIITKDQRHSLKISFYKKGRYEWIFKRHDCFQCL